MVLLVAGSVALAACGSGADDRTVESRGEAVRVASFDFPESVLLGEMLAQALEARDVPVERVLDLGPREVVQPALQLGVVDVVPEYLGSLLDFVALGQGTATIDVETNVARLRSVLDGRDVLVLEPGPAENTNVVVLGPRRARELRVRTIGGLEPVAGGLRFSGPPECPDRALCLPGLEEVYGLEFGEFVPQASSAVRAEQLRRGEVDVALLFSTDAVLVGEDFVVLVDDRDLQPAENILALARGEVVDRHGQGAADVLQDVTARLTTTVLARLNQRVADGEESIEQVAADHLSRVGLG
jgi:osmoprotectant transport system substrate-binding protein